MNRVQCQGLQESTLCRARCINVRRLAGSCPSLLQLLLLLCSVEPPSVSIKIDMNIAAFGKRLLAAYHQLLMSCCRMHTEMCNHTQQSNTTQTCHTYLSSRVQFGDDQASGRSSHQSHAQTAAQRCQLVQVRPAARLKHASGELNLPRTRAQPADAALMKAECCRHGPPDAHVRCDWSSSAALPTAVPSCQRHALQHINADTELVEGALPYGT